MIKQNNFFLITDLAAAQQETTEDPQNSTTEPFTGIRNAFGGGLSTSGKLWCYECSENYEKEYDVREAICKFNLSLVTLRQCNPEHDYCMVSFEYYLNIINLFFFFSHS